MASTTAISTIAIEPEVIMPTELNEKEKFAKRFKPSNLKQSNQKRTPLTPTTEHPLQADDIKEHRLWSIGSLILCFFVIGPIIAFYHSRRVRKMKNNQEFTRAKLWSDRINNMLIISNIIGIFIWVAILFIIGVLLIFGAFY